MLNPTKNVSHTSDKFGKMCSEENLLRNEGLELEEEPETKIK